MLAETVEHSLRDDLVLVALPAVIAACAAVTAAWIAHRNRRTLDTGNAKDLGTTVHDMAQTQEVQAALTHTNTRELLDVAEHLVTLNRKLDHVIETQAEAKSHRETMERELHEHVTESLGTHAELRADFEALMRQHQHGEEEA